MPGKICPIYYHPDIDAGAAAVNRRPDTALFPNATVAVLAQVSRNLGCPGKALDGAYPGPGLVGRERTFVSHFLPEEVEATLQRGDEPVVYATLSLYNAGTGLADLRALKQAFGPRVRTGVGGHLITGAPDIFRRLPYIDQVAAGDAEVILEPLLYGRQPFAQGRLKVAAVSGQHCAWPCYDQDTYLGIEGRLDEAAQLQLGPLTGMRQLLTETVRGGCAWAFATGRACTICALPGVTEVPIWRAFEEQLAIERMLAERHGANYVFDVSNLWPPTLQPHLLVEWLQSYIKAQNQAGGPFVSRYVYLTSNAITEETAPLLRQAGVRIVFIGWDGWDKLTLRENGKAVVTDLAAKLQICRDNGLYVRTAVVINRGLTPENLARLPAVITEIVREYRDVILTFSVFKGMLIPGSSDWRGFEQVVSGAPTQHPAAAKIFATFGQQGWLSHEDQVGLSQAHIMWANEGVDAVQVDHAYQRAVEAVERSPVVSFTYNGSKQRPEDLR